MRVVDTHRTAEETAANLSRLMDDFASVSMASSGSPAIGGYRVIHAHRPAPRRPRPAPRVPVKIRTPFHMTGIASVLLISCLGVAAFSGPAACPTCQQDETVATAAQVPDVHSRLAYAQPSISYRAYRAPLGHVDLAAVDAGTIPETRGTRTLETVELSDSAQPVTSAPISTAAIEPSAHHDGETTVILPNTRGGLLPARTVVLKDATPKPVRLAAVTPVEATPASVVEIEATTVTDAALADKHAPQAKPERKPQPVAQTQTKRKHASSKRRTYRAYRSAPESPASKRKRLANIPPWAEKMFVPDWQSKAFSY